MDETWYFARNGQRMGPFSFEQLKQMASSGVLNMGDMMLRLGEQQWIPAKSVEGLFTVGPGIPVAVTAAKALTDRLGVPETTFQLPPQAPAAASAARRFEDSGTSVPAATLPPVPGLPRAAGVLWCVFGSLVLLLIVFTSEPFSAAVIGLIGGSFNFVGVQTIGGWARDVLGNGLGSLILGGAAILCGLGLLPQGGPYALAGVMLMVIGLPLVAAGICALSGRGAYKKWRREKERQTPTD